MSQLDLLPFRQLLDEIVVVARRHGRRAFLPVALPLIASGVLLVLVQIRWMRSASEMDPDAMGDFFLSFALILSLSFAIMLLYAFLLGALTVTGMEVTGRDAAGADPAPASLGRGLRYVLRPAAFGTLVLVLVANLVAFLMCFLPVLYVGPVLSFVLPVMVEERRFGMDAIRRSIDLAHFNPTGRLQDSVLLQVLVFAGVGTMINYVATFVTQMPFAAVQWFLMFRETVGGQVPDPAALMSSTAWLQIPMVVLSSLVTVLVWLYWAFGICVLYREVRRRREAADLAAAIAEITGEAAVE